jgi:DNA polymerase-1
VYGTGYKSLAKELKKSERIAKQWLDTWYRKHPAVRRYQNMVWDYVKENGYIDTPFGRTRFFNLRRPGLTQGQMNAMYREAINMPIQGTASDIVLTGLGRLWKWMRQEGFRSQMVWEVHDSIGIDCYENEIETIILKGKEILEGVSYKWMRGVPLVVDVSVGKHWGRLEELEV